MRKYILSLIVLITSLSSMYGQSIDQNYVKTTVYKKGFQEGDLNTVQIGDKLETVQYFDGLGRPMQSVAVRQGGNDKDIITHITYDELGRQIKNYLPYASTTNNGLYRNDALSATNSFYNTTKYENTLNPYSEQLFDGSPLNLIIETAAPGNAWQEGIQEEHTVKKEYKLIENTDEVYNFHVNYDTNDIPQLINNGLFTIGEAFQGDGYRAPTLYKFIIKNENWVSVDGNDNTTQTFKDYRGRTLLNRTFESGIAHDTYYVYDNYGNLCFVIPPKVTVVNGIDNLELNELCYQYIYDKRNRLIEKQIPGKGREYIVYNNLDQPILTQDANQGTKSPKEWLFTKYDAFGRVIYTGIYKNDSNRSVLQGYITSPTSTYEEYETLRSSAATIGGTDVYYTNNALPTGNLETLTVNYYDKYNDLPTGLSGTVTNHYGVISAANVKGLPTVNKVRVLGTSSWITTVTYYDDYKRSIYGYSKNDYLGTTDIVESKYTEYTDDIRGLVQETKTTHQKGVTNIITIDKFTYDHSDRMLTQIQKINSQAYERIVQNNYDDLGQLVSKEVGGKTTKTALQNIEYQYNIRGWLKQINDVNNLGNDLFAFKLNYNNVDDDIYGQIAPLYNGNISETYWKTKNDNLLRGYGYAYDAQNRLKDALYEEPTSSNKYPGYYNTRFIDYDKNGNITYLKRYGKTFDDQLKVLDRLYYIYQSNSNKLLSVSDTDLDEDGFYDGNNSGNDYDYDDNGNLISDANKGITSVTYNHLNMPTKITVTGTNAGVLDYTYSADGIKLQKIKTVGANVTTTDYAGDFVYENNVLKQFNQPEGYVEPDGSGWQYVYRYVDIWGNTRITYADDNNDGTVTSSEIRREQNYYPFGLEHQGYNGSMYGAKNNLKTYQKQEFTEDLGLNTHEWKYRISDPAIGRFWQIDPLAEKYTYNSTYAFQENKMGMGVELEGLEVDLFFKRVKQFINGAKDLAVNETVAKASREIASAQTTNTQKKAEIKQEGKAKSIEAIGNMGEGLVEAAKATPGVIGDGLEAGGGAIVTLGVFTGQPEITLFGEGVEKFGTGINIGVDLARGKPLEEIALERAPSILLGVAGKKINNLAEKTGGVNNVTESIIKGTEKTLETVTKTLIIPKVKEEIKQD